MTEPIDPQLAAALRRLLPGPRRSRMFLFLVSHPEIESADFLGSVQFDVKDLKHVIPFIRQTYPVLRCEEAST